jgi:hypothetical protein
MRQKTLTWFLGFTALLLSVGCQQAPLTPASTQLVAPTLATTQTPSPSPLPTPAAIQLPTSLLGVPVPESARQLAADLTAAEHPAQDFYRLAVELQGHPPTELTPTITDPPELKIDDRRTFKILANPTITNRFTDIPARLRFLSEASAWWVSIKSTIDDEAITSIADRFEKEILPVNRLIFGQEARPGLDQDPRLQILLFDEPETWGGVYGYFTFLDQYTRDIFPNSNMAEMFYLNLGAVRPDSVAFMGELAHEYQHLIHFNQDPNEDQWLNEGMSELAVFFTGAVDASSILGDNNAEIFAAHPNIQLTHRPEMSSELDFAHYAAERLFFVYLLEQFGPQLIKDIVSNPHPGVNSIQQELSKLPNSPSFDEVYANWLMANFLDMPGIFEGQFGYKEHNQTSTTLPRAVPVTEFDGQPQQSSLPPYGARYYEIRSDSPVTVDFRGATLARLTPADPPAGSYAWYSNRGDLSEFSLSRAFDLSGLQKATLNYKVWYELDKNFDYGYVEVSVDGGETWKILETAYGTDENPVDQAYGRGYSGGSEGWLDESLDLSAYAGQEIMLRFHVITDFTANRDGLQIDEISIPELGYYDGAEDDSGGWQAKGFVRSTNFVPAEWIMWVVTPGPRIDRVTIPENQQVDFTITTLGDTADYATLIVAPTAPTTTQELDYELTFTR